MRNRCRIPLEACPNSPSCSFALTSALRSVEGTLLFGSRDGDLETAEKFVSATSRRGAFDIGWGLNKLEGGGPDCSGSVSVPTDR